MRTHTYLLIGVVLTLSAPASHRAEAQNWNVVELEAGVTIRDMCILPDGVHGWAVGTASAGGEAVSSILRTGDGGASWVGLENPAPTSDLSGVDFADPLHGWVVGSFGRIYATSDGGESWSAQTSGITSSLSKVDFVTALEGWATGGFGETTYIVIHTTDGGLTWQNQSFGPGCYSTEDICFADAEHGWIVGRDSGLNAHIHRTTDGGATWTRQTVPPGAGPVSSIDMVTKDLGWASTSSLYHSPAGAILHTTDGGIMWVIQTYTHLHYNYCIDAQDADRVAVAAVQILSPAQERVFVTTNGGVNWDAYTPPITSYTYGIQYVGDTIAIGAEYSRIVRSADHGASWEWAYHAPLWNSMAWSDPANGWIVSGSFVGTDGYTYRTSDGGTTWAHDASAPGGARVQFVDPDHGWTLVEGSNASVWRTTDGGDRWSRHTIGGGSWIEGLFFATPDSGWAHGANGTIRFTSDGGVTWNVQSSGTSYYVQTLAFVNSREGWAGGGYGGGNGFMRHTTNGGATWVPQAPANSDHPQCMFFKNDQEGWVGAVGGRIHRTTDGGQTWQVISQVNHTYLLDIMFLDSRVGYLAARNPHGGAAPEDGRGFIYRTEDGGLSWQLEYAHPWPRGTVSDLVRHPGGELWACGQHSTILRSGSTTGIAGVTPHVVIDLWATPNPFTVSTELRYELGWSSPVTLGVYDIEGRRLRLLVDAVQEPGAHAIPWDGLDASGRRVGSGVYFGKLVAGEGTSVSKILLGR